MPRIAYQPITWVHHGTTIRKVTTASNRHGHPAVFYFLLMADITLKFKTRIAELERENALLKARLDGTPTCTVRGWDGRTHVMVPLSRKAVDAIRDRMSDECSKLAGEGRVIANVDGVRTYQLSVEIDDVEYGVRYSLDDGCNHFSVDGIYGLVPLKETK